MIISITTVDPTERMPDDSIDVLLGMSDGMTCQGFRDGDRWYDATGWPLGQYDITVVWWADMPVSLAS